MTEARFEINFAGSSCVQSRTNSGYFGASGSSMSPTSPLPVSKRLIAGLSRTEPAGGRFRSADALAGQQAALNPRFRHGLPRQIDGKNAACARYVADSENAAVRVDAAPADR